MKLLIAGVLLLVGLVSSCKKDQPPSIVLCIGDGVGGADCDIPDGDGKSHKEYWLPSQLKNSWITTQDDAAKLLSWCYNVDPISIKPMLEKKKQSIILGRQTQDEPTNDEDTVDMDSESHGIIEDSSRGESK